MKQTIALWGLPGSGKTWFLQAFKRRISILNRRLVQTGCELSLIDMGTRESATRDDELNIQPTQTVSMHEYMFVRKHRAYSQSVGFSDEVSSHSHLIRVIDDAGANIVGGPSVVPSAVDFAITHFEQAECIVLLLDEGNLGEDKAELLTHLKTLRHTIHSDRKPRYIAACIAKTDILGFGLENGDPKALFSRKFGRQVGQSIVNLLENGFHYDDKHRIEFFSVSAMGYLKQNNNRVPNINAAKDGLGDESRWEPVNVELPFFWLFNEIEMSRLNSSSSSRILTSLYQKAYYAARTKAYIPYKKLLEWEDAIQYKD